jgi:hypothetical protein
MIRILRIRCWILRMYEEVGEGRGGGYNGGMTLILEHLPEAVTQALEKRAKEEGRAVQDVAVEALRRGLETGPAKRDLSDIVGSWVDDPEFDKAMKDFERVEPDAAE